MFSRDVRYGPRVQEGEEPLLSYHYEYVPWRGITRETMEFFDVVTKVDDDTGEPLEIAFPYPNGALKIRSINEKRFRTEGPMSDASGFGVDKFEPNGKAITIVEGELDALSFIEILGRYPIYSVRSASSARSDVSKDYNFLNSFERVYLSLDNDEKGKEATRAIAALFDFNKVYQVKAEKHKDANDYLVAGDVKEFRSAWYSAKRFLPDDIISTFAEVDKLLETEPAQAIATYPFKKLQEMSYGVRGGETVLLKAPEGIGKTEILRAIEHHILKTTDYNIGTLHLEEERSRGIRGLAGYELGRPAHLPDSLVSKEEIKQAYRRAVQRDERLHIVNQFGSEDPKVILDNIRFLAGACQCKIIFLDHITMIVTGLEELDERRVLDYISTRLAMMAKELGFCLIFISHVNDDGKTRGSRNISKVAHLVISLSRNLISSDIVERNTTHLMVEKNRFGSTTGPAGELYFDPSTFMITDKLPIILPPLETHKHA